MGKKGKQKVREMNIGRERERERDALPGKIILKKAVNHFNSFRR